MTTPVATHPRLLRCTVCVWAGAVTLAAANSAGADAPPADASTLGVRVARLQEQARQLAGEEELLDTLYFGWSDRPYARATLAIVAKTAAVLAREVEMRDHGNGAIADTTVERMWSWANEAVDRAAAAEPDLKIQFRPHRRRVSVERIRQIARPQPLFALIDSASSTRHHADFGDLSLLAPLGVRVHARPLTPLSDRSTLQVAIKRTAALGMATVLVHRPSATSSESAPIIDQAGTVVPVTLSGTLIAKEPSREDKTGWIAVADPVFGESWPCSLARRGLARGVLDRPRYSAVDWKAPVSRVPLPQRGDAAAAAMWMHAVDGQALGLIPGWRDLRDGSASPHASLFTEPATLERMAHANLDLLKLTDAVACFNLPRTLAMAVGTDAIDAKDGNAWAGWVNPVWAALASHQIPFDVVFAHARATDIAGRYRTVFDLRREEAGNPDDVLLRVERALADGTKATEAITVRELDGGWPSDVFTRVGQTKAGAPVIAMVNLSDRARQLKVQGGFAARGAVDKVANERVVRPGESVSLAPWQVRILFAR